MADNTVANFVSKSTNFYSIDAGVQSEVSDLGLTYYRLTCGNGDGYGFYQNGEYVINASKVSIERVGSESDKSVNDQDTFCPSKIILAEAGDIYFEAVGGDIILKGNNIYMHANGSEGEKEGHVIINANQRFAAVGKDVSITASDSVSIHADNSCAISGRMLTNINGGLCTIADRNQFSFASGVQSFLTGDIFSPSKILDIFSNFIIK